jgi:hypothetical protein
MLNISSRLSAVFAVIIVGVLFGSSAVMAKGIAVATSKECLDNPLAKGCSFKAPTPGRTNKAY